MRIQTSQDPNIESILALHTLAFGRDKQGPEVAQLTDDLLHDPSALPLYSFIAEQDDQVVGHILFTQARLASDKSHAIQAQILAPLAVHPNYQRRGIGQSLIQLGLETLESDGIDLVFVLGHPEYYPKAGFEVAAHYNLQAPYPILPKYTDAWMVKALSPNILGNISSTVLCAKALDKEEHWQADE
ncbi:N-acetyltransferase [Teredinibacter sp. KSP-S5-2]|uniref:GNAT family N-acetyltransferase n=1 Tax=Teredinibacter sp. KSP-S5-2 TaxID=3034506 RepID=UPI002934E3C2|nr:N-acetyltransferase [Teredinibacter sp. KSP-S5-2]WNO08648.1 N-acetyltransferase [Teredinibacter sp. KSP-S5-2]